MLVWFSIASQSSTTDDLAAKWQCSSTGMANFLPLFFTGAAVLAAGGFVAFFLATFFAAGFLAASFFLVGFFFAVFFFAVFFFAGVFLTGFFLTAFFLAGFFTAFFFATVPLSVGYDRHSHCSDLESVMRNLETLRFQIFFIFATKNRSAQSSLRLAAGISFQFPRETFAAT